MLPLKLSGNQCQQKILIEINMAKTDLLIGQDHNSSGAVTASSPAIQRQ
jgi:hypothetical protein